MWILFPKSRRGGISGEFTWVVTIIMGKAKKIISTSAPKDVIEYFKGDYSSTNEKPSCSLNLMSGQGFKLSTNSQTNTEVYQVRVFSRLLLI